MAAQLGVVMAELVRRGHLADPSQFAATVAEVAAGLGARDVVLYRVDYHQTHLVPVPSPSAFDRTVLSVEGSLAGRAFVTAALVEGPEHGNGSSTSATTTRPATEPTTAGRPGTGRRLWVPLLDGTERLGVMELTYDVPVPAAGTTASVPPVLRTASARYAALVADMLTAKAAYGDVFEFVRRRERPSVAAEIQWNVLPPLTVATESLVLSAVLEPAYNVAGDSFDYALNGETAHLAVFDAMGHGLASALFSSVAVGAYRNARRALEDLPGIYRFIDDVLVSYAGGVQFATGLLVELDVPSGVLRWVNAGHLAPLLLRGGRLVGTLEVDPATPLGLGLSTAPPVLGRVQLQPGDRVLLYTDGVVEARTPDGDFFGVERLVDLLVREASSGHHVPESLRRLGQAVLAHQSGPLIDDATTVLLEWRGESQRALVPE